MPIEVGISQTNFFPCLDTDLQRRSSVAYLASPYPSVSLEGLDIENNIESLGGQGAEETIRLSIHSSLTEALVPAALTNQGFSRWYDNSDYTDNIRVRYIICLGEQGRLLDFITQRMNEFQAGIMSIEGDEEADNFYGQVIRYLNEDNFNLVSPLGPFGGDDISEQLKNSNKDKVFYAPDSSNRGIVLHDVAISSFMKRDANGRPLKDPKTKGAPANFNAPAASSLQEYQIQKINLNPVVLNIGKTETYTNTDLSRIRVYAFTYFDTQSYLRSINVPVTPAKDTADIILKTGVGFITKSVYKGVGYTFVPQENSSVLTRDAVDSESDSPRQRLISDSRNFASLKIKDVKTEINKTTNSLIRSSGINNKIGKIIKNDNFFSEFWVTRCENDNARYGFVFDKLAYLVENSQLPFLYQNIETARDLLMGDGSVTLEEPERARCLNVMVKRRQIQKENTVALNDLSFGRQKKFDESYYRPDKIVPTPQEVPALTNLINEANLKRLVFYEGYDTYEDEFKTLTDGIYQYSVEFLVYDPSANYLRKIVNRLTEIHHRAMEVYELIINSPPRSRISANEDVIDGAGLYNIANNERVVPLTAIRFQNSTAANTIFSDIDTFVSLFITLSGGASLSQDAIANSLISMAKRKNPMGIKHYADIVNEFKGSLEFILSTLAPKDPNAESTTALQKIGSNSVQNKAPMTKVKKYFDNLFEYGKQYGTGYLYLSEFVAGNVENLNGLPVFSKDFFDNRRTEEFNKYFNVYAAGTTANTRVPVDGTPYEASSYQYFSPKAIKVFGKETLVQTRFKADNQNIVSYDLDKYAETFADLARIKNLSHNNQLPFTSVQQDKLTMRGVFDNVNKSLFDHGCIVSEGITQQFSIPGPGESKHRAIKMTDQGKEGPEVNAPRVVSAFLGGDFDTDEEAKDFLQTTEKELAPFVTGTYGAVLDPSALDKDQEPPVQVGLPPTKLSFAIFGELELDRNVDAKSYMQETFNSMVNNVNSLGIDDVSIRSSIETTYASMPNQYKSMFVLAASQKRQSLAAGFDAVRPKLEESDVAEFKDSISYISENEEFPPYQSTRDPMKSYAKFLTFWMNYKQIAVVEYLAGFENLDTTFTALQIDETDPSFSKKPLRPRWEKFTPSFYNNNYNRSFLCRVRDISKDDLVQQQTSPPSGSNTQINKGVVVDKKDFFDLPIYNSYFLLTP